jgi:hypothetical protein
MFFKNANIQTHYSPLAQLNRMISKFGEESCSILGDPEPFHNALLGSVDYPYGNLGESLMVTNSVLQSFALQHCDSTPDIVSSFYAFQSFLRN